MQPKLPRCAEYVTKQAQSRNGKPQWQAAMASRNGKPRRQAANALRRHQMPRWRAAMTNGYTRGRDKARCCATGRNEAQRRATAHKAKMAREDATAIGGLARSRTRSVFFWLFGLVTGRWIGDTFFSSFFVHGNRDPKWRRRRFSPRGFSLRARLARSFGGCLFFFFCFFCVRDQEFSVKGGVQCNAVRLRQVYSRVAKPPPQDLSLVPTILPTGPYSTPRVVSQIPLLLCYTHDCAINRSTHLHLVTTCKELQIQNLPCSHALVTINVAGKPVADYIFLTPGKLHTNATCTQSLSGYPSFNQMFQPTGSRDSQQSTKLNRHHLKWLSLSTVVIHRQASLQRQTGSERLLASKTGRHSHDKAEGTVLYKLWRCKTLLAILRYTHIQEFVRERA